MSDPYRVPSLVLSSSIAGATLGQLLRLARQRKGLGRRRLAQLCKVSPQYIHRIEIGRANPSSRLCLVLAQRLGLEAEDVLLWAGHTPPDLLALLRDHRDAREMIRKTYSPQKK